MKLICIDLESPLPSIPPATLGEQWVLVRLHRCPIGMLKLGRTPGLTASELGRRIADECAWPIAHHLAVDGLRGATNVDEFMRLSRACPRGAAPRATVTVAVCTRNRAAGLADCLDALMALDYPAPLVERLVIDNAPSDESTANVVARYPGVRYIREPRPGLDWARNRAIREARHDIVAFIDDDVIVDDQWVRALARTFEEERDALCVTGLVVPDALDSPAQVLFEQYGGFGRGFSRAVYRVDVEAGERTAPHHGGTGKFGTGANMAFRRETFSRIGLFDPALDVGTPANGGGDLEMFFRVLKEGGTLVYEPCAVVRHRHCHDYDALKTKIRNNGIGFYAYLVRAAQAYPDERGAILRLGVWWMWWWNVRRLLRALVRPAAFPRDLILAELRGSIAGLRRYAAARRHAARILAAHGAQS